VNEINKGNTERKKENNERIDIILQAESKKRRITKEMKERGKEIKRER
jgi:hypothetical protein